MLDIEITKKTLEAVADILEDLKIKYYLDSGTLLGAYRDQSLIKYDHDIDIRIMPDSFPESEMGNLVHRLWDAGFYVITHNYGKRAELICVNRDKVMLDLKFAFRDKQYQWIYCWEEPYSIKAPRVHVYPRKFFRHMGEIELYGRKYPCPEPIEEYLAHHYGDWRAFKVRPEQAEETDLTWDYMHSPPCAKSLAELKEMRGLPQAVETKNKEE